MAAENLEKLPEYSREDVKKHNTSDSCWLILDNEVFDVTTFLYEHPGGDEVLLERAGGDGTDCFDSIGHSLEARERRTRFRIGVLQKKDHVVKPERQEYNDATADEGIHSSGVKTSKDSYTFPAFIIIIAFIVWFYIL